MTAAATVSPMTVPAPLDDPPPVVLIDAVPEPRLIARRYTATGPLDRRSALLAAADEHLLAPDALAASSTGNDPEPDTRLTDRVDRWIDSTATLAIPARLVDDQIRWTVVAHGRLTRSQTRLSTRADDAMLKLTDRWDALLDQTLAAVWWQTDDGLLFDDTRPAVMRTGSGGNRSHQVWPIGGRPSVHVFQEDGQAWTVGAALEAIDALAGLELNLAMIPGDVHNTPLQRAIDLAQPIGDILERLIEPCGLVVQRDLRREAGAVVEHRAVRPIDRGRTVTLAWARDDQPLGQVLEIDADRPSPAARRWVAEADGWVVESTFVLIGGWDPSLEGEPDSSYSKLNNPGFGPFENVFRLWALNEDGRFSAAPFHRGDPFDLTTFFSEGLDPDQAPGPVRPRPLRFEPGLTLDDTGARRSAVVEFSLDSGQTWSLYTGPVVVRTDRAGVYLDDVTLDAAYLAAAKAGGARVRVTASLRSPVPVTAQRWSGNPFAGTVPKRRFDVGGAFGFRRVMAPQAGAEPGAGAGPGAPLTMAAASIGSIHFNDIINGDLEADEVDQTAALASWLIHMVDRSGRVPGQDGGRARLDLSGAWPVLRVGDRLVNTAGGGTDAAGRAEAIAAQGAIASSLTVRWGPAGAGGPGAGARPGLPSTLVDLVF